MRRFLPLFLVLAFSSIYSNSQTLVHYWNFNNSASEPLLLAPTSSLVPGSSIVHNSGANSGGFVSVIQITSNTTGQGFETTNPNARNGDAAASHLRFNNPIGGNLVFSLPTTGYQNVVVKYGTRRSGQGAHNQVIDYSLNGTNFVNLTTLQPVDGNPTLQTLDFTGIPGANNNPNFKVRISFTQGGGGLEGNNRFDNFTLDGSPLAGDIDPPSVAFLPANNATGVALNINPTLTFNKEIRLIDNNPVTNANVASLVDFKLNNAAGANLAFTASITGQVISIVPTAPLTGATTYYLALKANMVEGTNDVAIAIVQSSVFTTQATSFVSFAAANFISVSEADGSAFVTLNVTNPVTGSFKVSLMPAPWSNAMAGTDFAYATTTINTTAATPTALGLVIPVFEDVEAELDEYFVIGIEDINGYSLQGRKYLTIYIRDNDRVAPVPTEEIKLKHVSSFKPGTGAGTAEVSAYDSASKRLFVISAVQNRVDIVDLSNPAVPANISSISLAAYGGGVNSVSIYKGLVALAIENADPQQNGSVVFLNTDGGFLKQVTVGAMPDMLTFTKDGTKVLTANEGEPNSAYTIDPEGSVSIIDLSAGIGSLVQANVTTVYFTAFNSQEAALIAAGVRKVKKTGSTLSQDLEPEYITFSPDGTKAWVSCQENNSLAELDIATATFTNIRGLGLKDFNLVAGGGVDASNNSGVVHISNWPVKSFYMPDAISSYSVGGKTYIVTANEGDEKELAGLNERTTVGNAATILDPVKFPNAVMLKEAFNIGNFRITNLNGDTDGDGDYDELISVGARSFSIWDAETGTLVWDSKDEIELFTAKHPVFGAIFNADHESNALKGRSNSKGPEPEGLTIASIGGQQYVFVTLERIGGLLVYNITDPTNPKLVDYRNERTLDVVGGDRGAESVIYLSPDQSPDGKPYVIVSNEISGTITIYEITGTPLPVNLLTYTAKAQSNGTVLLQWATVTEKNNSHFTIERSHDGRIFVEIGKVAGKGDSNVRQDYSLVDAKPGVGQLFYRLNQTDKDGKVSQKGIRMVDLSGNGTYYTIAPNPVIGNTINLKTDKQNGTISLRLADAQGRVVAAREVQVSGGNAQLKLDSKIAPGMYFMQVDGKLTRQVYIQ